MHSDEDLDSADGVEHMGIMAGSGSKSTVLLLAGQHKVNSLLPGKAVGVS